MFLYHEAPNSIFEHVQSKTDGDYALVHLLEENPNYAAKFMAAKAAGRHIILDNSVYELGEACEDLLVKWIEILQPDVYIIPDVIGDCDKTIDAFNSFMEKHPNLPGMKMGAAQGSHLNDFIKCYNFMKDKCDVIAVPFGLPFYSHMAPSKSESGRELNQLERKYIGRILTCSFIDVNDIVARNKPHHLLGNYLPQEVKYYSSMPWVKSIDTSNPVLHGMENIKYANPEGLFEKSDVKMHTLIDMDVTAESLANVDYNLDLFRNFSEQTLNIKGGIEC